MTDELRAALERAREAAMAEEVRPTGNEEPTWHNGVGVGIAVMERAVFRALAASAIDEGPLPDWFPDDPKEVKFLTHGEAIELIAMARRGVARPAVPALDAMTLGRAMDFVDREDEAIGVVGRGRKVDRIIEAYAALRSKEPTE